MDFSAHYGRAGVDLVGHYEGAGFGMTWANVAEDEFSMAWILLLLLADSLFYAGLAWYVFTLVV